MQDEITRSVVGAIEPRLLAAEGVRALARSADDLGAWELVARAQTHVWRLTREDYATAIDALQRAVDSYPDYAPARSLLAFLPACLPRTWAGSIATRALRAGREHAVRAIALDDRDPWGQIALGYLGMMERRTEEAIAAFQRAVDLNPNSAAARCDLSHGLAFAGRDREAIEHAEDAIRLSPLDPEMAMFFGAIAVAHYYAGRYAEAAALCRRSSCGCVRAFRARNACAAPASPSPARIDEAREFLEAGAERAAAAVDRMDQGKRALSDAGTDGALSRWHAKGGPEMSPGASRVQRRGLKRTDGPGRIAEIGLAP